MKRRSRLRGERGATFVEYALIISLVVVASLAALQSLGGNATARYRDRGQTIGEPELVTATSAGSPSTSSVTTSTTLAPTSTTQSVTTSTTECAKKCK